MRRLTRWCRLAHHDPAAATKLLPRFAAHQTWQVRMYAARAAGVLGATGVLLTLGGADPHDNVREAALSALIEAKRSEAMGGAATRWPARTINWS